MSNRLVLLTTASFVLSGCCGGSERYNHPTTFTPTSSDRPDPVRERNKVKSPKALKKRETVASGSAPSKEDASPTESELDALKPYSPEWWSVRDAIDRASEVKLAKKLIICRNCMPSTADEQTGSVGSK
jgi:ABC-type uncharacterized transport system auxiliary subunit